jgi:hypothetical protein
MTRPTSTVTLTDAGRESVGLYGQRLTAPEVARDDDDALTTGWRRRMPPELAALAGVRPGPADRLLLAFIAERGVQTLPPDADEPRWHVSRDEAGVVLSAAHADLRMALLDLWRQDVYLTAEPAPVSALPPSET